MMQSELNQLMAGQMAKQFLMSDKEAIDLALESKQTGEPLTKAKLKEKNIIEVPVSEERAKIVHAYCDRCAKRGLSNKQIQKRVLKRFKITLVTE